MPRHLTKASAVSLLRSPTCVPISKPYKLVSREFKALDTVIDLGDVRIGSHPVVVMAGPCVVESASQIDECFAAVVEDVGSLDVTDLLGATADQPGSSGGPGGERKDSRDKRSKERPEGASA